MKKNYICFVLCCIAVLGQAQTDSLPGVFAIFPEKGDAYTPFFSPFCSDRCWLNNKEFDIPSRRFVPKNTEPCIPAAARREWHNEYYADTEAMGLWWRSDPYDQRFLWMEKHWNNTLFLWRYDQQEARKDSFFSMPGGSITFGKPGIWVTNNKELVLLDRRSGQVLCRAGNPENGRIVMDLQASGEDVIVTGRWLYQRAQNRYVPFFALPSDMEGCKSPQQVEFKQEICCSMVGEPGDHYAYFLRTPNQHFYRLPFDLGCCARNYILAVNAPLAWFCFPDKLLAFNFTTGDSLVYYGSTGTPLNGNQDGRFLGFYSERGLSFFDKSECRFSVLNLPYGFPIPRDFCSDQEHVFLTYEKHWEIVDCSSLDANYKRSPVLDDYKVFEQEWRASQKGDNSGDFYSEYDVYLKLFTRYKQTQNPKITVSWAQVRGRLIYTLYTAPDTTMERITYDYEAGRFDRSISSEVVEGLFRYWGSIGALQPALRLIKFSENQDYLNEGPQSVGYLIDILKTTQRRLDSLELVKETPDARLYAMGKIWLDYCFSKISFRFSLNDPWHNFEQAYAYFRTLIQKYPNSPLADNAAYDMLQFIDYQKRSTDDYMPEGNPGLAYKAFLQFLEDYPKSDQRPDVLLRLAKIILEGVYLEKGNQINEADAAQYLEAIAEEYPEFAKKSESYQIMLGMQKGQLWSQRWSMSIAFDQDKYRVQDTIRVTVKLYNKSQREQTLDSVFLLRWNEGLMINIRQLRDKGCDEVYGYFPMFPEKTSYGGQSVRVAPGASYEETFVLGHTSLKKYAEGRQIEFVKGGTYSYYFRYDHIVLRWLSMEAQQQGRFSVE